MGSPLVICHYCSQEEAVDDKTKHLIGNSIYKGMVQAMPLFMELPMMHWVLSSTASSQELLRQIARGFPSSWDMVAQWLTLDTQESLQTLIAGTV